MKTVIYNKPYELDKGLNLLIDTDIVELVNFNKELLEDYIDDETDFYIGFYTNPDDLKIYNKLYYQGLISQNPEINKKAYDLLPIIIYNNRSSNPEEGISSQFDFTKLSENKFYFWNKYFQEHTDKKIKFIYKNLGTIKIDWESQLEGRKKELETGI